MVCWGGHSISREEYDYTKEVGYELGLRGLDICTGCGPGAMKGPMKGATIGHAKQRIRDGRYLGITEPGIIAAESPNPIVNDLVIMPDIEKRLEAFVRTGHGIVVFPGGAGTAEEILYLLGILLHPDNAGMPFPLILTGPAGSADYFREIEPLSARRSGEAQQRYYQIIIDDPAARGARNERRYLARCASSARRGDDAYYFNWLLKIDLRIPATVRSPPTKTCATCSCTRTSRAHTLAANLRRAFSGIVAGNVKDDGIRPSRRHGQFEIRGEPTIMEPLDSTAQVIRRAAAHETAGHGIRALLPYREVGCVLRTANDAQILQLNQRM